MFKPPKKPEPWMGILDAFAFGNECVQPVLVNSEWKGDEDCLFLNVYVPSGNFVSFFSFFSSKFCLCCSWNFRQHFLCSFVFR